MAIMTPAKFHFNWLMLTLLFGIWASEPPPGPGERLKRPGLIGLRDHKTPIKRFQDSYQEVAGLLSRDCRTPIKRLQDSYEFPIKRFIRLL